MKKILIILSAIFTGPAVFGQESNVVVKAVEPYFYVVAADPQLFFKQQDDRNWTNTIAQINRLQPDFMIVCGDLVQCDNKPENWLKPGQMEAYDKLAAAYLDGAKKLDSAIPLYNVAGNHDVSIAPNAKTLSWYRSKFGAPWYAFEHKNSLFVVLESNLIRDPGGAPEEGLAQWTWLDEKLAETSKRRFDHKTVYMHHPLCLTNVDEADSYFNIQKTERLKLLNRFHDHGFSAAFCGHYHRNAYVKDGELELVTTSSCGAALGKDPLGFRIVKVYPDRLEHQYYGFEDLPEKVLLDGQLQK
jgi:3',5'-cyclic AMP phosphodiesterase CpdA